MVRGFELWPWGIDQQKAFCVERCAPEDKRIEPEVTAIGQQAQGSGSWRDGVENIESNYATRARKPAAGRNVEQGLMLTATGTAEQIGGSGPQHLGFRESVIVVTCS